MKRCSEEPSIVSKRQLLVTEDDCSPMAGMLTDALSHWAGMRSLFPSSVPATRGEALNRFEPLLRKSSKVALKMGLALMIASLQRQLPSTVVQAWELASVAIYRANESIALPLYPRMAESLADAMDRLRRLAAVLDLYCQPLHNFQGTVRHFQHLGLFPALSAINALLNAIAADLMTLLNVLSAGPSATESHTFCTGPVTDLMTVTPSGELRFQCVSCRSCPIYLPDDCLEDTCGYCQCQLRFHTPTAPVFVRDLLLDADDLQEAIEFGL